MSRFIFYNVVNTDNDQKILEVVGYLPKLGRRLLSSEMVRPEGSAPGVCATADCDVSEASHRDSVRIHSS